MQNYPPELIGLNFMGLTFYYSKRLPNLTYDVSACTVFGNDVFSKHLFPMVSYTQNTHKIPIPSDPRSTLLPSPLPRPLQPV